MVIMRMNDFQISDRLEFVLLLSAGGGCRRIPRVESFRGRAYGLRGRGLSRQPWSFGNRWQSKAMPRRSTISASCMTGARELKQIPSQPSNGIVWPPTRDMPRRLSTSGEAYRTGRGVDRNMGETVKWYQKAAELGLPQRAICPWPVKYYRTGPGKK